jgi:hypothetical protein
MTASLPEPLAPRETMGRNDPCWCRSGRKWKHCHRDRDKQHRPNINELLNAIGQEQARGYCVHPDAGKGTCSGGPTDAHTIQKEGGLRAIAEQGHVVAFPLSYRAIAYEKFLKKSALWSKELHRQEADKGQPFAEQVRIQEVLYAAEYLMELGLRDLTQSKDAFDAAYRVSY